MKVLVIQNNAQTPAALVGDHLVAAGATLDVNLPHNGDTLPASPDGYDAAIILGGPQHAGDDVNFPAFPAMLDLLRGFHDQAKPMLGLCLGSQLLARAFGEKVRRSHEFEVGYPTIEITEDGQKDPLLTGLAPRQRILQWHEDTFDMPKGAVQLMTGATIRNQAFRLRPHHLRLPVPLRGVARARQAMVQPVGPYHRAALRGTGGPPGARARAGRDRAPRRRRGGFLPRGDAALGGAGAGRAQASGRLIRFRDAVRASIPSTLSEWRTAP